MTLTIDEQERIHAAELESMTYKLMDAIKDSNVQVFDQVRQKLLNFLLNIEIPSALRYKAKEVHDSAAMNMAATGIAQMTAIAESLTSQGSGIRNAIRIAETGKKDLLFPSLAADAAKVVALFEKLREAADKVEDAPDDLKDKISAVAEAAQALRDSDLLSNG